MCWPDRLAVRMCASKLLGLPNYRIREVSSDSLVKAVSTTVGSLVGSISGEGRLAARRWGIDEIALAIDIDASTADYVRAYRWSRWPRARSLPDEHASGLIWGRRRNRLAIYDKRQEVLKKLGDLHAGEVEAAMRVERSWRGRASIAELVHFAACGDGFILPWVVGTGADSRPKIQAVPVSYSALHLALARELSILPAPIHLPDKTPKRILAAELVRTPRFREEYLAAVSPGTRRSYLRIMQAVEADARSFRPLLRACYGQEGRAQAQ